LLKLKATLKPKPIPKENRKPKTGIKNHLPSSEKEKTNKNHKKYNLYYKSMRYTIYQ